MKRILLLVSSIAASACTGAFAAPVNYEIETHHTYPSFEADHMGISTWRGKFNKTTGNVSLDKAGGTGAVEIVVDTASVDFGHDKMNEHAMKADMFDVAKYPTALYKGQLLDFKDGAPGRVVGELTLRGVTKPVELKINSFKCIQHPFYRREACGADAIGTFKRDDFGMDAGKAYGFNMDVTLRIQVEAVQKAPEPSIKH